MAHSQDALQTEMAARRCHRSLGRQHPSLRFGRFAHKQMGADGSRAELSPGPGSRKWIRVRAGLRNRRDFFEYSDGFSFVSELQLAICKAQAGGLGAEFMCHSRDHLEPAPETCILRRRLRQTPARIPSLFRGVHNFKLHRSLLQSLAGCRGTPETDCSRWKRLRAFRLMLRNCCIRRE